MGLSPCRTYWLSHAKLLGYSWEIYYSLLRTDQLSFRVLGKSDPQRSRPISCYIEVRQRILTRDGTSDESYPFRSYDTPALGGARLWCLTLRSIFYTRLPNWLGMSYTHHLSPPIPSLNQLLLAHNHWLQSLAAGVRTMRVVQWGSLRNGSERSLLLAAVVALLELACGWLFIPYIGLLMVCGQPPRLVVGPYHCLTY
ncbi:unnamed protein product [Microthlaspi erraticum]|uniref:Uncharacterized protein n=1 Tax=Microthlaspi erraticum TaxID=1685480 RepID=A0A6D2JKD8_9BRAS|nr:unnamed protein product [Microthlaspi erraticum]